MSTDRKWTRSDAQAEVHRIAARGAEVAGALGKVVRAMQSVGRQSGHPDVAALGVDALRDILGRAGLDTTREVERVVTLAQEERRALEEERDRLRAELEEERGWWGKVLGTSGGSTREFAGGMLLGLSGYAQQADVAFPVRQSPDLNIEPQWLIVDPDTCDGSLLDVQFANVSGVVGRREVPLSTFNPRNWASVEALREACAFAPVRVSPAHHITLHVRLNKPGPFRAVVWGRAYEPGGQPWGADR